MDISVVIPTRERKNSLRRLLISLKEQPYPIKEIIIVDSSQSFFPQEELNVIGLSCPIHYYRTAPSVTVQRNYGIKVATSEYVFLCDDDMEVPPDYLPAICEFLKQNPGSKVITGIVAEKNQNGEFSDFPAIGMKGLIWNTIFQLGVWTDMDRLSREHPNPIIKLFQLYYKMLGNRLTLAGYPLVTQIRRPYFTTALYGFGAAVVDRKLLLDFPYDEVLDEYGIGDHYRIALQLSRTQPVVVLTTTRVYHHKINENRLDNPLTLFRRLLTLDYIFRTSKNFSVINRIFLLWSILGQWITYKIRKDIRMINATKEAFMVIITGRNPYVSAFKHGTGGPVNPQLLTKT